MRLIDADVLLDSIFKSCNTTEATINNAPTIDAVPVVRGWWIPKTGRAMCSVCADECWADSALEYAYCPNCGANMEEREK